MNNKPLSSNQITEAFHRRHATKKFRTDKKISDEDIALILEAARLSPSSYGFEPWNIIDIQNKRIVKEIIDAGSWGAKRPGESADRFMVITAKRDSEMTPFKSDHIHHIKSDIVGLSEEAIMQSFEKYKSWIEDDFQLDGPGLLHQWCARQAYIALGNMMSVAALRGIDSCPIEGFSINKVSEILEKYNVLNSTKDLPVVMLALGYRDGEVPTKTRRTIEEIVTVLK